MTITEYFNNYKRNTYSFQLDSGEASTVGVFYEKCLKPTLLPPENVIAWHKMLLKYAADDDAILWIRYYENGPIINGRYNNRRACLTEFKDGFKYAFISNFDVHEIFNMISKGVVPDLEEFKSLMQNRQYPLHYDSGKTCYESDIKAYPNIGSVRGGRLTEKNWYLAHVFNLKNDYILGSSTIDLETNKKLRDHLFPRGKVNDWTDDDGFFLRKLNYSLTDYEKKIVKAHFLRFVDPLNYFATPGTSFECDIVTSPGKNIGEFEDLTKFMGAKFKSLYGEENVEEFYRNAMCKPIIEDASNFKDSKIDIKYGVHKVANSKKIPLTPPTTTHSRYVTTTVIPVSNNKTYSDSELIIEYLFNPQTSFRKLEMNIMHIDSPVRGGGFKAKTIINSYGITADKKGVLSTKSIDEEIAIASGTYLSILLKIKSILNQ